MQKQPLILLFLTLILIASVPRAGFTAEGPIVFRQIAFGDSQKTVRIKTLQDDFFVDPMVNLGNEALSPRGQQDLTIEGHSFQMIFFFNQDGLYRMDLMGTPRDENHLKSLRQITDTLRTVLVPGLKEPSNSRPVQSTEDLRDGFTTIYYWSSKHTPGQREAFVGITSAEEGYKASMIIKDPSRSGADPLPSDSSTPPELSADEAAPMFSAR